MMYVVMIIYYILWCFSAAGSEGTQFVFSFPRGGLASYQTEVRITARKEATVTLTDATSQDVFEVPTGGSATYTGDLSQRVTHGIEEKGFKLTSDAPVSVVIGCPDYSDPLSPDDMLLRPLSADDMDFVITSFAGSATPSSEPLSFFSITASENDTTVSIYNNGGEVYASEVLNTLVSILMLFYNVV